MHLLIMTEINVCAKILVWNIQDWMTDNDIRNYKYMISNGIKEDKYDVSIEVKFNLIGENNMIIVI